jgi:hypothetical protein
MLYIVYEELMMKSHEKFHSILNVLLNIRENIQTIKYIASDVIKAQNKL